MKTKISFIIFAITLICIPQVHAFTFFGIDFGKVWDKITFWDNEENNTEDSQQLQNTNKSSKPSPPIEIELSGTKYTKKSLQDVINNNDELKGYIKGFNYDCIYINTDKNASFTLYFNTQEGTLTNLKKGDSCDNDIYLEESLIADIQQNGFNAKEIKTYLEKVDLPWGMYAKAVKVFTIG